jgi:hypothetical protein
MSAKSIHDALQTVHAAITGVTKAPTVRPASINTSDMPLVLVRPVATTWDGEHALVGMRKVVRAFEVAVYVGPVAQGMGVDETYQEALVLLDRFGIAYCKSTLPGVLGVNEVMGATDTGLSGNVMFGGTAYQGFVYTVTVKEKAAE